MLVSLYTVRVVLNTLGVEDYGIYNVVAGVVTMFGFLSGSMATASQRYFSFELGRGDFEQLKKVFSLSLFIYILIGIAILLLGETIGLWFVSNKLVIPLERKSAALWVYQFSIISFLFTMLTSPYMAMIIAYEDMNIYAYVSIGEALFKLGIVFLLQAISWDKLILYGILMLAVVVTITAIYRAICIKKYNACKFSFYWNKGLFKEIAGYSGWNMFGASAGIFKNQVVNIMLNQFFNPVVVAARSIAAMVDSAAVSLSQNFSTAIRPQIIKSYAAEQKEAMFSLVFRGAKGTYLLMYLFVLPLVLEMPIVLTLWLKNPPEYTVLFTRLMLFDVLINSLSYPIMAAAHATGKIRLYQAVVGGILLLNVPVVWIILFMGAPAYSAMIVAIILTFIACIMRLLILKVLIDYSIRQFLRMVILPICVISVVSAILPIILCYILPQNILRLFLVTGLSIMSVSVYSYSIGLNKEEQGKIKSIIRKYIIKGKYNETCQ
jgi:O-antigen/teichoic acid export membrane protein